MKNNKPIRIYVFLITIFIFISNGSSTIQTEPKVRLKGTISDEVTGDVLPGRVYIQSSNGRWFFPKSTSPLGSSVEYQVKRQEGSIEMHTTLSPHPFAINLKPGTYTVTVERGKEYFPFRKEVVIKSKDVRLPVKLRRWIDMGKMRWYSGDTHVHRALKDLPNIMLAENLNVTLPLQYWVTAAYMPPNQGDKNEPIIAEPKIITIDNEHVIYPRNTEYEIFSVAGKKHTLGAVFILGHKALLEEGIPPVRDIAKNAHRDGAILDLDKHSWPWSLMLVPIMEVDLFELANNHLWRTQFGYRSWSLEFVPKYMNLEMNSEGLSEWGWIDFGFQTYYALLNCGFRIWPSAGTASGVHPVPLGFGRVYVHLPGGFDYKQWMSGLANGRSFVTTGPMLFVKINDQDPGSTLTQQNEFENTYMINGSVFSARPLDRVEVVVNGSIRQRITPSNHRTLQGSYENLINTSVDLEGSGWIAIRCFENQPDGRMRFAHSSPVHVHVPGKAIRPRRKEIEYLIGRIQEEMNRNKGILSVSAIEEYRDALNVYKELAKKAF